MCTKCEDAEAQYERIREPALKTFTERTKPMREKYLKLIQEEGRWSIAKYDSLFKQETKKDLDRFQGIWKPAMEMLQHIVHINHPRSG